ncbi:Transmembrane protein [Phytophthora megakarya]|uniref:Transmembrane protein n=1 Tax=Phytophthora megakarya TaxID=4795 RepID=A0A225W7A8_9STRA|nr:Transmembrane protein [Phytophthora megakarya]
MTMVCGCGFLYAVLDLPTLEFHHLKHSTFPSTSFQIRHGFVNVLRWLESLNSRHDLLMLGQILTQARIQARNADSTWIRECIAMARDFAIQVQDAVATEMTAHVCKLGLQCGLVLFLFKRRVLSKDQTIPTLCLCILDLICWKMAQTCLYEMLSPYRSSKDFGPTSPRTKAFARQDSRDEVIASFLNALFVARYSSICVTNVIFGRAYQVYFCEPWPTKWKRVPAYLGSKNLVLGTLFFATASVSAMSVALPALRSLCEATTHIEAFALVIAFGHYVFLHFQVRDDGSKIHEKMD